MKSTISIVFAAALAGCAAQPQAQSANPLAQPLGASIPAASQAEPTAAVLDKMMPYMAEKVFSPSVPQLEMRPFRECFARAVYGRMTDSDRSGFDQLVASGRIMDDDVIVGVSRYMKRAIADPATRTDAGRLCPKYAAIYAAM